MLRTAVLHMLAMLLLVVLLKAGTPPDLWETANGYAAVYRQWAALRNVRVESPGTISAPEMLAWQRVKSRWRHLEKQVDAEYEYGR